MLYLTNQIEFNLFPYRILINGDISETDLYWHIFPVFEALAENDIEENFNNLNKLIRWAKDKKNKLKIKMPLLFKFTFFLFNKTHKE